MKRRVVIIAIILAAAGLGAAAYYWQYVRLAGVSEEAKGPGVAPAPDPAAFPLKLPPGFAFTVFARGLEGARVLALDPKGTLLVSLTSQGRVVALPDKHEGGRADAVVTVLEGLNQPHGLAFGPGKEPRLYVAETDQVAAYDYDPARLTAANKEKIADLPPGGRHFTRSLLFLPAPRDYRLLIYGAIWRRGEGVIPKSPVGNARKCTFCVHRLEHRQLPMCVTTCIGRATLFGDLNDPTTLVSQKVVRNNAVSLKPELGTTPKVRYLL